MLVYNRAPKYTLFRCVYFKELKFSSIWVLKAKNCYNCTL